MAARALIVFGVVLLGFMALLENPDRLTVAPREVLESSMVAAE